MPVARLAVPGSAAESVPGRGIRLAPCDAVASGAEEAQVRLARGTAVLDLCAHHFHELEVALVVSGWRVTHDNRGTVR